MLDSLGAKRYGTFLNALFKPSIFSSVVSIFVKRFVR